MKKIHFISNDAGSLGEVTKDIFTYLKKSFIVTNEMSGEMPKSFDILVSHFISEKVTLTPIFSYFRFKVLIQPIDGTFLTPNIVKAINRYDLIITPGNAGKRIMKECGVTKPIKVIPNFYKPDILKLPDNIEIPKLDNLIDDKFIFYHESTCHPRKRVDLLCESYVRAFSSNSEPFPVVLILKTSPHNDVTLAYLENIKKNIIQLQKQYKYPVQILKISQQLPFETLYKLWHKVNTYVSFAGIEGFGIPMLRMAILGKLNVTLESDISGYTDFLNESNAIFVKSKKNVATKELVPIYDMSKTEWVIPECMEDCEAALLDAYYNYLSKSKLPTKKFLNKYTYENIMKEYENIFLNVEKYKKPIISKEFIESDIELL